MNIPDEYLPASGAGREEFKVLYSWSADDAIAAQSKWDKTEHPPTQKGPIYRWDAAYKLKDLADDFEVTGDQNIILFAISICALNDLSIPQWCSVQYLKFFRKVWSYEVKSWDDAFGKPNPTNAKVGAKRMKREKMFAVYSRVMEIKAKNPDRPTDRTLFDEVGRELGICGSLADTYYYSAKRCIEEITNREIIQKLFKDNSIDTDE